MYLYKARIVKVVDGDTLDMIVDLGFRIKHQLRIRLAGIDTPEIHGVKHNSDEYKRGMAAKKFVEAWVKEHKEFWVQTYKTGKYGRWIATVRYIQHGEGGGERILNEVIVEAGHAESVDY